MKGKKLLALLLAVCLIVSLVPAIPVTNATPSISPLSTKEINILLIGNSYASDTVNYLAEIFDSAGYTDFNIVSLYYSGATLSRIYEEMLLAETAEKFNFADRNSGVYKYGAGNVKFTYNNGTAIADYTTNRNFNVSFAYQKYTKTAGGEIQSHNTIYNYNLKQAIMEDDWDVVSLQNINNDYDKTVERAYTALSASGYGTIGTNTVLCDTTTNDYTHVINWNGTDYYAGGDYVGRYYVDILTDYIIAENGQAQSGNVPKVWFNSTWVPDQRVSVSKHAGRGIVNGDSQGKSAIYWESELNKWVYPYTEAGSQTWEATTESALSTANGNKLAGWIPNNLLIQYMHQGLSNLSNTNRLWRDGVHLSDIGRYAVALNYYYNVTGTDFTDPKNRVAFVPDFEMQEHLDEIYDCLTLANADALPTYVSVKYHDVNGNWQNPYGDSDILTNQKKINNPWYLVGGKVKLVYTKRFEGNAPFAAGKYGWTSTRNDAGTMVPTIVDTADLKNLANGGEVLLYCYNLDATDVATESALIGNIPTYITIDDYAAVTEIYDSVAIDSLTVAEFNKLYATGELTKLMDAKRRVDALKAENTQFFVDFDTNGSDTAETFTEVFDPDEFEAIFTDYIAEVEASPDFIANFDIANYSGGYADVPVNALFWAMDPRNDTAYNATTGDGYNSNYHMKRTGSAANGFTYYPTLMFKQNANNTRIEVIVNDSLNISAISDGTVYTRANGAALGESSAGGTLNGNAFKTPTYVNENAGERYLLGPFAQKSRIPVQRQIWTPNDGILDGAGLYEISFKFAGNTGHIGEKLQIYTQYTDENNYTAYRLFNDGGWKKLTAVDGVITAGASVYGTVNAVAVDETAYPNSGKSVASYFAGTNTFTMRYNGTAYEITVQAAYEWNRDNNKQKVTYHWLLPASEMLTDFYFSNVEAGYFDNFQIKTVDIDSVNSYVQALDLNAITKTNDVANINNAYSEYLKVIDSGMTAELGEGIAEKIVVAKFIADYLVENNAEQVTTPADIDALSTEYKVENKDAYQAVITAYDNFVEQGLSTIFTQAQKDKVAALKVVIDKNADYDYTGILNLIVDIDNISEEVPRNALGFTTRVDAYRNKLTALETAGYAGAVRNAEKLTVVEQNLANLNGKFVDTDQLTFKPSNNKKYSENTSGSWNMSAQNGIVSMLDVYTGSGIDSIKFQIPVSNNNEDTEHMFIYDYQGLCEENYEDFSGFGFTGLSYEREPWNYTVHRETEHSYTMNYAPTYSLPSDCSYAQRNIRNFTVGSIATNPYPGTGNNPGDGIRDDWARQHEPTGNTNGNANIIWYLAADFAEGEFPATATSPALTEAMATAGTRLNGTVSALRLAENSTVTVEMTYQGDENTVKGFNWYLVKVTGDFVWKYTPNGGTATLASASAEVPAVYFRLFYTGRFKDIGITHNVSEGPEDVLTVQELSIKESTTELTKGASVRLTGSTSTAGIRFESTVNTDLYAEMKALAAGGYIQSVELGTLITQDSETLSASTFTHELGTVNVDYLDAKQTKWQDEANGIYTSAVIDIQSYSRLFAARGYMKVTDINGEVTYYYSDFTKENNVRSIQRVATAALADTSVEYTSAQKDILEAFATVQ